MRAKCAKEEWHNFANIQMHGLDFDHVAPLDLGNSTKDKDLTLQSGGDIQRS